MEQKKESDKEILESPPQKATAGDEEEEKKEKKLDLIVAEEKIEGDVTFRDYVNFFSFTSCGCCAMVLYAFVSIVCALL